jgi:hypothetical protein
MAGTARAARRERVAGHHGDVEASVGWRVLVSLIAFALAWVASIR